jgi:hypothetical protein
VYSFPGSERTNILRILSVKAKKKKILLLLLEMPPLMPPLQNLWWGNRNFRDCGPVPKALLSWYKYAQNNENIISMHGKLKLGKRDLLGHVKEAVSGCILCQKL